MKFASDRLLFREFIHDDFQYFSSIFSNDEVMKYAYMDRIQDENEMTEYFSKILNNVGINQSRNSYEFAVFLRDEKTFIGLAIIEVGYHFSRAKYGEIGYFLLPKYWGKGYATEIAEAITDFCFIELKFHKVVASCNANNSQSEKIMKKIGMTKEGELRKERYKNSNWDNEIRYGLLVEEWENKT